MSHATAASEVAVIIPAKNEAERIAVTVAAAAAIPEVRYVMVVDDASTHDVGHRVDPSRSPEPCAAVPSLLWQQQCAAKEAPNNGYACIKSRGAP
jgi:hypothetical protein